MNVFFHSGDLGDCIAALPTIRHLGGGKLILGRKDGRWGRTPMTAEHASVIIPLLKVQEYIFEVEHNDNPRDVTHCFHEFRTKPPPASGGCGELYYNLATWQAHWFGIKPQDLDLSPWLTCGTRVSGRSVVARSLRYQNPAFDWRDIVTKYSPAIFVGLPDEWANFPHYNCRVDYISTDNLLEVAGLIAGSEIFIGNQSAPCWIALGLGKPLIQEMDRDVINRNSVIERENAKYVP